MSLCLLALAMALMLLTPSAQAAGKTWYVDDDGTQCPDANFSTIQQAINNASADDVIIVCNGTYNENISVDKPLVILSQNGPSVTFINGGGADVAVFVNASGVTFGGDGQGFNVTNAGTGTGIAMYTGEDGIGEVDMSGVSIVGNVIHGCADDGIRADNEGSDSDIYGVTLLNNTVYSCDAGIFFDNDDAGDVRDNTVEGNTVYDCYMGITFDNDENSGDIHGNDVLGNTVYDCYNAGISFSNDGDGDIDGNTVADNVVNNSWSCIDFYLQHYDNGSISGNTVFNNTVHHCLWGIDLWEDTGGDGSGDISGNTVEGNTVYNCSDAGIDLWSASFPSVVGNSVLNNTVYNCYTNESSEIDELAAGILLYSGPYGNVSGNTIEGNEVHHSMAGICAWSEHCGNISNNDIAGNTVYNTSMGIVLNASWCLVGFPFTGTGSAAAAGEASGTDGRHRLPSTGGMGFPAVSRDGSVSGWSASGDGGIAGEGFGQPLPFDIGIYDNTVAGNEVYNYESVGIGLLAGYTGLNYRNTVEGNTVYNASTDGEFLSGIALVTFFGLMGEITVAGNTVYDSREGILLLNFGDGGIYESTVEGNTVWWCEYCIDLYNEGAPSISGIDIRDNVLYNRSIANESGDPQSFAGVVMYGCDDINVSNNSMAYSIETGLVIEDSWYINVTSNRIFNNSEGIYLDDVDDVRILRNDILDNGGGGKTGIYIDDSDSEDIEIHCNNIAGNGIGVDNWASPAEVNASWNWWGNASGPSGDGPGSGDAVWDADYDPWLNASVATNLSGLALNATAVPSMVSVYDWWDLFGYMEQEIYTLGPSYTDIIVEVDCNLSEGPCGLCRASVNLSALLLQILPAGFVEDYVEDWCEDGQYYWEQWMDDLSKVEMGYYDYGSNGDMICFYDYDLWLEYLFFWDDEYSEGGIALEIYFNEEYPDGYDRLMDLIFEELRLGQVQVPVDLWPCGGERVTVYVPLTVVDFQLPLDEGWNLRSAPLKLDSNWDTIGDVYAMGDGLNGLEAFITWDSEAGMWVEPGPTAALDLLHAYYIKMAERDQMGFIVDRAGPQMWVEHDMHAGWNLVGMVPDFLYHNASLPEAYPFPAMDPWRVLNSVNGGWAQAVNMPEDLDYTEDFYYRWIELKKPYYDKYFWQEPFTVYPNGSGDWSEPPFVSPGGGFWVYMDGDDQLTGYSYTPLPWSLWFGGP